MKTRLALALLLPSFSLLAKEVPVDVAKLVAKNFLILNTSTQLKITSGIELTLVESSPPGSLVKSMKKSIPANEPLLYLFSINSGNGFIIVSADDDAIPVLGYSLENNFDASHLPVNYQKWIEGYKNQIRYIKANPSNVPDETEEKWKQLIAGRSSGSTKSTSAVAPLVTTKWNQSPYYNDLCPYDAGADENTVTGCAATAMAQIMKFWNYPETGAGYHTYSHDLYGAISANFGAATYDWSSMPDLVNAPNNAVATLMYHCGVSIETDYGISDNGGSGAYVIIARSPILHCVEYALSTYFNYDESLIGIKRDDYSTSSWTQLLMTELNGGRPIEYAGFGTGGGHAFVCDGYDNNNFFHFNWGWGGYYDGFFSIDALDPGGTGIGGGAGGYNSGHQALIGIKPPGAISTYDLSLFDNLTISENPLFYGDPYTIHTDIANFGTNAFSGDFTAAIFDSDYGFVEFAEELEGESLGAGNHYINGLDFTNAGSLNLLPGTYFAEVYYRPTGGNWKAADDSLYSNRVEFTVYYSNDIELYSDFVLSAGTTIEQGAPFTATIDILNNGTTTFTGELAVDLYTLSGDFAGEVETLTGAELDADNYFNDVEFSTSGVTVDPGSYLLALTHKEDGGSWTLSGSTYATNPIRVIVKAAPLSPDIYEDNNDEEHPFTFTPLFLRSSATIYTQGSNMHMGTDLDFYKVVLEPGYDYSIVARVHDSYNSGIQQSFSNDVVWIYLQDGEWSDLYDDVKRSAIEVPGGGEILFGVGPYFEGEIGTYLLDLQLTRTEIVSTPTLEKGLLKIYPNPVKNLVFIESSGIIDLVQIYDVKGRLVQTIDASSQNMSADISCLSEGVYFLHISKEDGTLVHKIVKQ